LGGGGYAEEIWINF